MWRLLRLSVCLLLTTLPAFAGSDIGIVLLHGKQGAPGDPTIAPLLHALTTAGYQVRAPQMCWSRVFIYSAPYPDCLHAIDSAVSELRAAGARRIVVAGQSLGGNAAIVYGAQHPDLAGVVALAPAPQPAQMVRNPGVAQSIMLARQMLASGRGDQRAGFNDTNNGNDFTVATTAAIYLSFVEPDGPANFPALLPRLREPVIWVAGSNDMTQRQAPALFARLPPNPLNKFVQVSGTHLQTPSIGADYVLAWLQTLPAR